MIQSFHVSFVSLSIAVQSIAAMYYLNYNTFSGILVHVGVAEVVWNAERRLSKNL